MRQVVGIIGGGAAGTLTATYLLIEAARTGRSCDVVVIDPRPTLGRGQAYSSPQSHHVLNAPAGRMSAFPDVPDSFVSWVRANRRPDVEPADFVPRAWYGEYLAATLDEIADSSPARVIHLRDSVVGLCRRAGHLDLTLSASVLPVDAAVLAVGNLGPRVEWAPKELRGAERFVPDPWAPGALDAVTSARSILLVGTGLTMVDVALCLGRRDRVLTAISRSGRLPFSHRAASVPPIAPPDLDELSDLTKLRVAITDHLALSAQRHGDWRPAFDGLRPVTAALWGRLTDCERATALRESASCWNRHRHRLAPQIGTQIDQLVQQGRLRIRPGEVRTARATEVGLIVELDDSSDLQVDAVVNCTGQETELWRIPDPLIAGLFESGCARPGPLGLGLDTNPDGQLLDRAGVAVPGLYTLGAPRVGSLWESTAIPEIRSQATAVSRALTALPVSPARSTDADIRSNSQLRAPVEVLTSLDF